jgi:hypothetical protein
VANDTQNSVLRDLLADLERRLIAAYLAGAGYDLDELMERLDDDARRKLAEASRYASGKLSEIEARAHYLQELRGEG